MLVFSFPLVQLLSWIGRRVSFLPCHHQLLLLIIVAQSHVHYLFSITSDVRWLRTLIIHNWISVFLFFLSKLVAWSQFSGHFHVVRRLEGSVINKEIFSRLKFTSHHLFFHSFLIVWRIRPIQVGFINNFFGFFFCGDKIVDSNMYNISVDCTDKIILFVKMRVSSYCFLLLKVEILLVIRVLLSLENGFGFFIMFFLLGILESCHGWRYNDRIRIVVIFILSKKLFIPSDSFTIFCNLLLLNERDSSWIKKSIFQTDFLFSIANIPVIR